MTTKKRIILNAANLTADMQLALNQRYPFGIDGAVQSIKDASGKRRLAVLLDTDETTFLVWYNPNQLDDMELSETDTTEPEDWNDDLPDEDGNYSDYD